MIDQSLRIEIRNLRARGMTYAEICDKIGRHVPKGTMSYICKDVALPIEYSIRLKSILRTNAEIARKKALTANTAKQKNRQQSIVQNASRIATSNTPIDQDKRCLAALYIAEGSKYKSYRGLALGSSDPDILKLYIGLLIRCYEKNSGDFRARIQHRADQDNQELQHYWSTQLHIPVNQFYLSYADKRTIGKPTRKPEYKGVCVISCSGADIQLELDSIARIYGQKVWGIGAVG